MTQVLSFISEYLDPQQACVKKYVIKYYPSSHELEMKCVKTKRKFLSRSKILDENVSTIDFNVGNVLVLFSRELKLVDYGDEKTKELLSPQNMKVIGIVSLDSISSLGNVISDSIESRGLKLVNLKLIETEENMSNVSSGSDGKVEVRLGIEVRGEHVKDKIQHVSSVVLLEEKEHDNQFSSIFPGKVLMAKYKTSSKTTCCVIKPHILKNGRAGEVIQEILDRGFKINAAQIFHLDRDRASEFYEAYEKLKEYNFMLNEMISGPCLALEIDASVEEFRASVGPFEVDTAKKLYPNSIRAKFARNNTQNAVHCTDLEGERVNELSYFFDILANEKYSYD
ncbi:hypothetical protein CTEN210_13906 [Chaetoceros tenuissimus]|uniref:DM10 domain-containing protein n=1 Tax=Chaetoceros tenuissimus TaxID=426638 RepID=A0AAD3D6J6_9STRA|nr:hypothetical protein CTEN210_13906 [Chaetoceros tenuissimus]